MARPSVRIVLAGWALLLGDAVARAQTFEVVHPFDHRHGQLTDRMTVATDGSGAIYGVNDGGVYAAGALFRLLPDGVGGYSYEVLYSFQLVDGWTPGRLIEVGSRLYGTTVRGGAHSAGTFFVFDPSTRLLRVLHDFQWPPWSLVLGADGQFYGVSIEGGSGRGTLFRLTASGDFALLHDFEGPEGARPGGPLLLASDGYLYGTTTHGGPGADDNPLSGNGTIFRTDATGVVTDIHAFLPEEARNANADLLEGSDGFLYGTAQNGGVADAGTVFRSDKTGDLTVLHTFGDSLGDGRRPVAGLSPAGDGTFLGTTTAGGPDDRGLVYRITPEGVLTTVADFPNEGPSSLRYPIYGLERTPSGDILGLTWYGAFYDGGGVFRITLPEGYEVLHEFGAAFRAEHPSSELVEAADGTLWGAGGGGASGFGTIFRLSGEGDDFTLVHEFSGPDGANPGNLLAGSDGFIYGTTNWLAEFDGGTIFRIDSSGSLTTLHGISGFPDGYGPTSLIEASDGNLYGTMFVGGATELGTLFRMTKSGDFTKLLDFPDPGFPTGIVEASDGNFYGTTQFGGDPVESAGTIFRSDFSGSLTILHNFSMAEGVNPRAGLIQASDGDLYGTTSAWGPSAWGNIFRSSLSGETSTLYGFSSDGNSHGKVAEGTDGFLYGVYSLSPGPPDFGPGGIIRVDKTGQIFSTVYAFQGSSDGAVPLAGPIAASDGRLYGSTQLGGWYRLGVIYRLDFSGSPPSIETVSPTSGHSAGGVPVTIQGRHLHGGASVSAGPVPFGVPTLFHMRRFFAMSPELTPGVLYDVTLTNTDGQSATLVDGFFADFLDAPDGAPFHDDIESLARSRVTVGCGDGVYCPDGPVTREQMAVFLLKAEHGFDYLPPPCTGVYPDVACPSLFADWIEQLTAEGIAVGCGGGNYCPDEGVRRDQMAAFLLLTKHGPAYVPPPCAGVFPDVACPSMFADWIEQLYAEAITVGCGGGLYCPDSVSTRGQMAVLLVNTFGL